MRYCDFMKSPNIDSKTIENVNTTKVSSDAEIMAKNFISAANSMGTDSQSAAKNIADAMKLMPEETANAIEAELLKRKMHNDMRVVSNVLKAILGFAFIVFIIRIFIAQN